MPFLITPARLSDVPDMARVNVAARVETYKDILSPTALAFMTVAKKAAMLEKHIAAADPSTVYLVAKDEAGKVVGLATGGPWEENTLPPNASQPLGEIFALYILNEVKGKGLGARLWREVGQSLLSKGFSSIGLSVLKDNLPACRFYDKKGGTIACPHTVTIADEPYPGLLYLWRDGVAFQS